MRFDIIYDYDNHSLDIFNNITGRYEISELNEFILYVNDINRTSFSESSSLWAAIPIVIRLSMGNKYQ